MAQDPKFVASTRRMITLRGQDVTIRRYSGKGAARAVLASKTLTAHVSRYTAEQLDGAGSIVQGDRRVVLMAADLGALAPLSKQTDLIVISGVETAIQAIDVDTRQVAGALEIQVRG